MTTMYNFDALLDRVGKMKRFQIFVIVGTYFFWCFEGAVFVSIVFTGATPDYRCHEGNRSKSDFEDTGLMHYCANTSEEMSRSCYEPHTNNDSSDKHYCVNGYEYDCSVWEETMTTEWDLICEKRTLNSIATFSFFMGVFVASIIGGILADKYGRRLMAIFSLIGSFIFNLALSFAPGFWWFCFFRFMIPLFSHVAALSTFTYLVEITDDDWRPFIGITSNAIFGVGIVVLTGFAYSLRNWRHLQMAISFCIPVFAVLYFFLPESPRWLFAYKQNKRGKQAMNYIARMNRTDEILEEDEWMKFEYKKESEALTKVTRFTQFVLLKYPALMKIFFNMAFQWFVVSMVYYGLTLSSGDISGDIFINTAVMGVLDAAGCSLSHPGVKYIGCRRFISASLLLAGITLILSISTISTIPGWVKFGTAFAFVGKFAISGTFATIYLHVPEIFPTDTRTSALGFCSASARIGSMMTPFARQLKENVPWATQVIFGCLSLAAAFLALMLPQTHRKPMLTTLTEAEEVYNKRRIKKTETEDALLQSSEKEI